MYLSRTKNTEAVARIIQKEVGGQLVSLELVTPYPEDYKTIVDQVVEENQREYFPPLESNVKDIEQYDLVFIGFPTWGMQLPPPIKTFLKTHNLGGKSIAPFNTNAGYGLGSSIENIKKLCPNSKVLNTFETKGGVERDGILFVIEGEKQKQVHSEIKKWLHHNKLNNN